MIYLKEFIKLYALDKIFMSNTSHDWKDVNLLTVVLDLKMVSYKRVILISHCHHLFVRADVKT